MNQTRHLGVFILLTFLLSSTLAFAGDLKKSDYNNELGEINFQAPKNLKRYNASGETFDNFQESWFTGNKMHMYLGLGSLLAAGITGLTAPDSEGVVATVPPQSSTNTTHYYAANAAAALGGAAIVSGLFFHLEDINLDSGLLDPDMLHMLLGIAGTAAYVYAISKAPKVLGGPPAGHPAAGIAGAGLMFTGILLEW